jgi:hypothetical protein
MDIKDFANRFSLASIPPFGRRDDDIQNFADQFVKDAEELKRNIDNSPRDLLTNVWNSIDIAMETLRHVIQSVSSEDHGEDQEGKNLYKILHQDLTHELTLLKEVRDKIYTTRHEFL